MSSLFGSQWLTSVHSTFHQIILFVFLFLVIANAYVVRNYTFFSSVGLNLYFKSWMILLLLICNRQCLCCTKLHFVLARFNLLRFKSLMILLSFWPVKSPQFTTRCFVGCIWFEMKLVRLLWTAASPRLNAVWIYFTVFIRFRNYNF